MTVPTHIPKTPMADSNHKSYQESKESSTSPRSREVLQHIINKVLDIQDEEKIQSFNQWMKYKSFQTFTELCNSYFHRLDDIHDHSEYKVDGFRFAVKSGTMNNIRLFIKWMITSIQDTTFELYAEELLALTRENSTNSGKMI